MNKIDEGKAADGTCQRLSMYWRGYSTRYREFHSVKTGMYGYRTKTLKIDTTDSVFLTDSVKNYKEFKF